MSELPRAELVQAFKKLGARLDTCRAEQAEKRRLSAPGFSVFDFIKPTENVLSDILAFFLDPSASHGQGPLFLRTLIGLLQPALLVDCDKATVAREARTYTIPNNRRLIDILIALDGFVLAIENKKFTGEGRDQIRDYCQHVQRIAGSRPFCLIFLNRTGAEAVSIPEKYARELKDRKQLVSWSWEKDIPSLLRESGRMCESAKIRHFIEDFETYIQTYLATQSANNEDEDTQ